jgi:hypothetical protein
MTTTETKRRKRTAKPVAKPEVGCDNPGCEGWVINNGGNGEIQRCDDCKVFASDDEARIYAAHYVIDALNAKGARGRLFSAQLIDAMRSLAGHVIDEVEAKPDDEAKVRCGGCNWDVPASDIARAALPDGTAAVCKDCWAEPDDAIVAGDQPTACPKCGGRTRFTAIGAGQSHICLVCNHAFAVLA